MAKSMSECLEEAARIIERGGWARRQLRLVKPGQPEAFYYKSTYAIFQMHPEIVQHCIIGACRDACPDRGDREYAKALGFPTEGEAFEWNDKIARRASTVINRLRKSAVALRKEEARDYNFTPRIFLDGT